MTTIAEGRMVLRRSDLLRALRLIKLQVAGEAVVRDPKPEAPAEQPPAKE